MKRPLKRAVIELLLVDDATDEAARRVARILHCALVQNELASIVLAGRDTAARFHRALAGEEHSSSIDWKRVHVFFGDEAVGGRPSPQRDPPTLVPITPASRSGAESGWSRGSGLQSSIGRPRQSESIERT